MNILTAKDLRQSAWQYLRGQWGTVALIWFVYSLISGPISSISNLSENIFLKCSVAVFSLLWTVFFQNILLIGCSKTGLWIARGGFAKFEMLFDGFKDYTRALVLGLVRNLFIFLWMLLFIVPGIIKGFAYSMSNYILIDYPDLTATEALKKSEEMMKGNKWRLFCLEISFIGWILLCVLTFGILTFWVSPYIETATAMFYQDLINKRVSGKDTHKIKSVETFYSKDMGGGADAV